MAAGFSADFEGGVNGATILLADSPGWDFVNSTPKYDTAHPAHGTQGANLNSTASQPELIAKAFTGIATSFGRAYIYATAAPTADDRIIETRNSNNAVYRIAIRSTGNGRTIQLFNNNTLLGASTTQAPLNTAYRLEWKSLCSTVGAGVFELNIYTSADSITAAETKTFTGLTSTFATITTCLFGSGLAGSATHPIWYDQFVEGATAYPGPFPVNTVAPTISGSAPVGSVLTAGNGTWNSGGTFNYTYQWTSGGTNIGGQTASTYTTVSGDIGNAIGCKVTATGQQATNENATQASSNTITPTGGIFLPGLSGLHRPAVIRAATR